MKPSLILSLPLFLLFSTFSSLSMALSDSNFDFSYMEFVYNATDLTLQEQYDYIIIGGGTAGCPLAATLSQDYSVLVLERGGTPQQSPSVLNDEGFVLNLAQPDDGTTPVEKFTSEDGIANARGRILGGTSMINAGFYSRADRDFYEKSGVDWNFVNVERAYQWVENSIVYGSSLKEWQNVVKRALLEARVLPYNGFSLVHLDGTKISGSNFDGFGRRHGAVELLNRGDKRNLKVGVHASVEKILFSNSSSSGLSAVGVIYRDSLGRTHQANINFNGEVILSAGALGSPQLLLLSGVGPNSNLSHLQIPAIFVQPNVGKFFYDSPSSAIEIISPIPLQYSLLQVVGIELDQYYIESISFSRPSSPNKTVASISEKTPQPLSVGALRLGSSTDVKVSPIVRFNYYLNQVDLDRCLKGVRKIGDMLNTFALDRYKFEDTNGTREFRFNTPTLPANQSDDAAIETFCRNTVKTMWHFHGGCLVGKVVDGDFNVIGINSLRVVDGLTFTVSPGTNPQATLMMMGRYVGEKILKQRMG